MRATLTGAVIAAVQVTGQHRRPRGRHTRPSATVGRRRNPSPVVLTLALVAFTGFDHADLSRAARARRTRGSHCGEEREAGSQRRHRYGFSGDYTGFSTGLHGVQLGTTRGSARDYTGFSWGLHGVQHGTTRGSAGDYMGFSTGLHGVQLGTTWGSARDYTGFSWGLHGVQLGTTRGSAGDYTGFSTGLHGVQHGQHRGH